jgi:phosphatidylserine/phosphatidylglycerophosphate/cardiolipin synthase-like enzyme
MTMRGSFRNRELRGLPERPTRNPAGLAALVAALVLVAATARLPGASAAQIEVCFSPPLPDGCDPVRAIEAAVSAAHTSILVQAYEITPGPLVTALIEAHQRGVDVRAIVDYRQLTDRRNHDDAFAVEHLGEAGIPVLVDKPPGLMHDKVMIIDGEAVVTGSFNYTYSAEHRNVENLLVIHDPALAAQYTQHWRSRASASRPLRAGSSMGSGQSSMAQNSGSQNSVAMDGAAAPFAPSGPIVGNRRTRIYEWPGCPGFSKISAANRVQFFNAQAAEQAGYRAARNCR